MPPPRGQVEASVEIYSALPLIPRGLRREVRPALRSAARPILDQSKANASWSRRIPRSLSLRTKFTGDMPGVSIVARRNIAPHARAFEGLRGGSSFRHPVFGNRSTWVNQPTRPFLAPAMDAGRDRALAEVVDALRRSAEAAASRLPSS